MDWSWFLVLAVAGILFYLFNRWLHPKVNKRAFKPEGKAILVTGAASGIGRLLVDLLVKEKCFVYAADLNLSQLEEIYGAQGAAVRPLALDVSDPSQVLAALATIQQAGKGLWGLVNSAGLFKAPKADPHVIKAFTETDIEVEIDPVFQVNVYGLLRVTKAVFPLIFESKGCIINIASMAGRLPSPGMGGYSMSKAAVVSASDTMRRELERYGVRVVCVEPGFLASPMLRSQVCLDPAELDYSQTLLKKGRGDEAMNRSLSRDEMASPSMVAEEILDAMFCDPPPRPHLIVDLPKKKLTYQVMCALPYAWVDRIIEGYERQNQTPPPEPKKSS